MAKIEKEVIKTYKLELSEAEYYAIVCLVGDATYDDLVEAKNKRASVRLGRDKDEGLEVLGYQGFKDLYAALDSNK